MKIKYILILFILFLCFENNSYSQTTENINDTTRIKYKNPEDTEFWLCFQRNFRQDRDSLILELFISGNDDASVVVEIAGLNFVRNQFVPKGTVAIIRIPIEAQIVSEEIIENLAIHVTSDNPISVYGLNRRKLTTDTYMGLPISVLGNDYRVMCYTLADRFMSQFAIVAVEDSTEATISLSVNSSKHPANFPYKIKLNKGEVYQVVANYEKNSTCDLTGSKITSNKNIAVFSGHQCAYVPINVMACNHLVEQMPPINSWGKHFYIGRQGPRTAFVYRVLANEPDTKVFEDNKLITTLGPGDYFESESKKDIQVTASKPVLVAQYSMGTAAYKDSIGDPMMIMISPTQQFLKEYRFATPVNGFWEHYINLVVPTKAIHSLRLDGNTLNSNDFKEMGISRYSIAHIQVPFGTHKITADLPFGLYSYGFGYKSDNCDAYGTMGGQSFVEFEDIPDTLTPMVESKINNNIINAIARDDRINDAGIKRIEGQFLENLILNLPRYDEGTAQVQFTITPANPSVDAKGIINISDAAANLTTYSVCYYYDTQRDKYILIFQEGEIPECKPKPALQIGALVGVNRNFTLIDKNTFYQNNNGEFRDNKLLNKTIGFYIGKQFFNQWTFSATLAYTNYNGFSEINGNIDSIRNIYTNRLNAHQNSKLLYIKGDFIELNARAEYHWKYRIYGLLGLSAQFSPNIKLEVLDNIIKPEDFVFSENNQRTKKDYNPKFDESNVNKLSFGTLLGVGYNYSLGRGFTLFGEFSTRLPINSMLSSEAWRIFRLNLNIGLKYNI